MSAWVEREFLVNGRRHLVRLQPDWTLLRVLRLVGYTGAKETCGMGICGSCTVLVDGKPLSSCIELAERNVGKTIETVEGLSDGSRLHPLQLAFIERGGFQCGFCTSGMLMTANALLKEYPTPSDDQIKDYMAGNLCRCTGYRQIVDSIKYASQLMNVKKSSLSDREHGGR